MPYQIMPALTPEHYATCEALLAAQYAKHNIPHHGASRWAAAGLVQRIMVVRDGNIVGSLDLIADSPELGLPVEDYYPAEVARLRAECGVGGGKLIYEVGAFATDPKHLLYLERDALFTEVCARLYRDQVAVAVCGIHPDHARLYRIFMGWEVAAPVRCLPESEVLVVLLTLTRQGYEASVMGRRKSGGKWATDERG